MYIYIIYIYMYIYIYGSPILFNILLAMVRAAEGVEHLGAVVSGYTISNLHFVDDIATLAESSNDLQTIINNIH